MDLKESWDGLVEALKRPFYSEREAFQDRHKHYTTLAKDSELENPYITYDPFGLYTTMHLGGANSQIITYGDMVKRWRDAAQLPEVDDALSEIVSEAIVFDEIEQVIELNLDDIELTENIKAKIQESFSRILYLLDFNERGDELFRQWYVDATLNFEVVYNNRKIQDGIQKLILLPPYDLQKFKNEQDSQIRWYINKHQTYNPIKDLENAEITYFDEQITQISSGILSPDKKNYFSPLQKAMKAINQLYTIEDSMILMRISKSTEKRAFYIDTGNLPKTKAEEYLKQMINKYRQKKVYNTETGTVDNGQKSISLLEDFWFGVNKEGRGTKVENLPGISNNFTSFEDVEYFLDKVYNALNIPNTRRNKESRVTIGNALDIEQDELKFFKYIQKLRRRFNNLFVDLLKKDLISKKVMSLDDWNKIQEKIKFKYASSNEISMIKKAQINQIKIDGANAALSLIDPQSKILSPEWVQENILRLTDEEKEKIATWWLNQGGGSDIPDALGNAGAGGDMGGDGGDGTYSEVGGAQAGVGNEPAGQPAPATPTEPAAPANRFQQKARESGLPQEIIDSLQDGDIITNGKQKLMYEKGKLVRI
jgi:hypothetical protein